MGIDGIRKSSPPAVSPANSAESSQSAEPAEIRRSFEIQPASSATGPSAVVGPPSALAALQSGAVDLNGYLDLKVNEATAHLVGLPASDLLTVRAAIRDRLASDPTLVDLVRTVAGAAPHLPDEE